MSASKGSAPAGKRLISGVEPHPVPSEEGEELWRVYVGSRWAWKYVLSSFGEAKKIYEVWQSVPELWVDLPSAEIFVVPREERRDSREDETEMFYRVQELMRRDSA